jgi:hypothetical protein
MLLVAWKVELEHKKLALLVAHKKNHKYLRTMNTLLPT